MTSQFMAYDEGYTGGVGLSTGWVAGAEGGAKSILTSQLAGAGTVRAWSSGSLLDGQPGIYLDDPNHHEENAKYAQVASFAPFPGGTTLATTSTTVGADLLVAGVTPAGQEVRRYTLWRSAPNATTLDPKLVATLPPIPGLTGAAPLGGR
jgi:hypothetical protein